MTRCNPMLRGILWIRRPTTERTRPTPAPAHSQATADLEKLQSAYCGAGDLRRHNGQMRESSTEGKHAWPYHSGMKLPCLLDFSAALSFYALAVLFATVVSLIRCFESSTSHEGDQG